MLSKTRRNALPEPRKPRVLVVVRWPVGGIRTWCRYVYRDPVFSNYDIELLLPDIEGAASLRDDLADTGVRVTLVASRDSIATFRTAVAKQIFRGKYSLVHSHGFTSGFLAAIPCRLTATKHLFTPHDVVLDDQYRDLRGRIMRSLIAMLLRSATYVQPVGEAAADNLVKAFPRTFKSKRNVRVVRNGIESSRFLEAEPEQVRDQYRIPSNAILVGFFGRFMGQKGFRYLVEAVANHKANNRQGRPLVVLAVGGGGFRREEELAIKALSLEESFRFVDFTPNVAGLIKAVDVVAMPSLWEACPLLPMEVLVAGTPLVVSDWSACVEVVTDTPAAVVPMRDPAALLEAVLEMSTSERKAEAQDFSRIAAARFDIASTIVGVSGLYRDIIGR
jgi:glycosyltransferase involved in cell wall biosynthesis